jgi:hypothetical protein
MSHYTVTIDNSDLGYKGELSFRSVCGVYHPFGWRRLTKTCDRELRPIIHAIGPSLGSPWKSCPMWAGRMLSLMRCLKFIS